MVGNLNITRWLLNLFIVGLVYVLTGCAASGPSFQGPSKDHVNEAGLYVYRPTGFVAGARRSDIFINNIKVADLSNGGYIHVPAPLGVFELEQIPPVDIISTENSKKKILNIAAGERMYFRSKIELPVFLLPLLTKWTLTKVPEHVALVEMKETRADEVINLTNLRRSLGVQSNLPAAASGADVKPHGVGTSLQSDPQIPKGLPANVAALVKVHSNDLGTSGTLSGLDPIGQLDSGILSGFDPADTPTASVMNSAPPLRQEMSGTLSGIDAGPQSFKFGDESTVPFISDRGREDYRTWLQWYSPKAFAISENGMWYGAHGNLSSDPTVPTDPSQRALQFCEKRAKMPCKLYAVDRSVVFGQEMAAVPK